MTYKVIDIYKDLPKRAGCSECGKPGCFAFATAVHLEGASLAACPYLEAEQRAAMDEKIAAARRAGEGPREVPEAQAARMLQDEVTEADLPKLARRAAVEHVSSPTESLKVRFLGREYLIGRDDVEAADGGPLDVWIKVMLLMYVTRATGAEPVGEWVAFRDLPNTLSKTSSFEKWIDRIAPSYSGELERLADVASELDGEVVVESSADLALRFRVLPRVAARLLLWEADEDFPARSSLLLDRGVLEYLDQEALTFLAEALTRALERGSRGTAK